MGQFNKAKGDFCKSVVVEHHHHVLPTWAAYRQNLSSPPVLLTIDHHTDTSESFRTELADVVKNDRESVKASWLAQADFNNLNSIEKSVARLRHDEHIQFAIDTGIISAAFVIAQNAMTTGEDVFNSHRIGCFEVSPENWNNIIESTFLDRALDHFEKIAQGMQDSKIFAKENALIVDIDLDAFKTRQSVRPDCSARLKELVGQAGVLSVATEPEFVRSCAIEEGLSSEILLAELESLLQIGL